MRKLSIAVIMVLILVGASSMFMGCGDNKSDIVLDTVRIELTQEAITSGKTYLPVDFSEIDCIQLDELEEGIFLLKLSVSGKQNVLDAVELLNKRNDIEIAKTIKVKVQLVPSFWDKHAWIIPLIAVVISTILLGVILWIKRNKNGESL